MSSVVIQLGYYWGSSRRLNDLHGLSPSELYAAALQGCLRTHRSDRITKQLDDVYKIFRVLQDPMGYTKNTPVAAATGAE